MSVHSQEESRVASLTAQAEASTAHAVSTLPERVKQVAVHTKEQTLRVIGTVAQQVQKENDLAVVSVMILGISYICAHVPMSPRARTSVPDDWSVIKVS